MKKKRENIWFNGVKIKDLRKIMANCSLDHNFQDLANFQHPMAQDRSVFQEALRHWYYYRSPSAIRDPEATEL